MLQLLRPPAWCVFAIPISFLLREHHDAGPYNAPDMILHALAAHHRTGLFSACGHEPCYQQCRQPRTPAYSEPLLLDNQ